MGPGIDLGNTEVSPYGPQHGWPIGPGNQSAEVPFLPAYLEMLQGKQPFPQDSCQPHDLQTFLIPCDQP